MRETSQKRVVIDPHAPWRWIKEYPGTVTIVLFLGLMLIEANW